MLIGEYIAMHSAMMKMLHEKRIRMVDFAYSDLFQEFLVMRRLGNKVTYSVSCLAKKYGLCEATVYSIIKRFGQTL